MRILARAHQQLIWDRVRQTNRLRNALREYFPAALDAFHDLAHRDAVAVLVIASGPREAARLNITQIRSALRRGGRKRNIERRAAEVRDALRSPQLEAPAAVSRAFAASTRAVVGQLGEINRQLKELEAELAAHFEQHPDAAIYRAMPGLGVVLGTRVLGEFGDDPERYESAKSRRNYAGTSPLTVASGRTRTVKARFVRNRRLYDAIDQWALCSLQSSPGCRAFYDRHRGAGDLHYQALRALATVEPIGALIIGIAAGVIIVYGVLLLDRLRIDDPVGAVPVHLFNGIWGTLAVGLFTTESFLGPNYATSEAYGLLAGGGFEQLWYQIIGIFAVGVWTVVTSVILFGAIRYTVGLRVSEAEEESGLDVGEHGLEAYPEFTGGRDPFGLHTGPALAETEVAAGSGGASAAGGA